MSDDLSLQEEEIVDKSVEISDGLHPTIALISEGNDISNKIVKANSKDEIEELTDLFKINQIKKNIVRANKLSTIMALIDDEIYARLSSYPDTFDNDQIIKYMTSTQQSLNSIEQNVDKQPLVQINTQKNEVNIDLSSGLNRESRARVLDTINSILSLQDYNPDDIIDTDGKEVE